MCVGTYGTSGLAGASACPSRGACSLVCSRIATSRSSSRMGGKAATGMDSSIVVSDLVVSVDMRITVSKGWAKRDRLARPYRPPLVRGTKAWVAAADASIRAM